MGTKKTFQPHYREREIIALLDQGLTYSEISGTIGVGERQVRHICEREKARREGAEAAGGEAAYNALPPTQRERIDRAIAFKMKAAQQQLDAEFYKRLHDRNQSFLERISASLAAEQAQAKRILKAREGFLTKAAYRLILSCLHPDWVTDPEQKAKYEDAFRAFSELEKFVLSEADSPTRFTAIPKTPAEWREMKRKATEARRRSREAITKR